MWVSPFKRTRETAEIIYSVLGGSKKTNYYLIFRKNHCKMLTSFFFLDWVTDIQEDVLLIEQQFGLFEGINWSSGEVDEFFPRELQYYNVRKFAIFIHFLLTDILPEEMSHVRWPVLC